MSYLLDANVFIEAAKGYYAFDIAPPYWDALVSQARDGSIASIDRVKEELLLGKDYLAEWANSEFEWFMTTNEESVMEAFAEVMLWVDGQDRFFDAAKQEFAADADGWLVAYARVNQCMVVTHERFSPECRRRVPLPNVCQAFGVLYCDTFDMLRGLGVRLG